jgi:pimeloyl-ACP methyl ester carboxylesterase
VETAAKDPNARGVILVAPYLYPTKKPGLVIEFLLAIPRLSDILLSKMGPKAMKRFIEKSAYPVDAPAGYREGGKRYATPAILRKAMTESKGRGPGIQKALRELSERGVPVLVIWGRQDQTGSEAEQISPLRKLFPKLHEVALESAGHALIWTHPEALAQEIIRFTRGGNT